MAYKISQLRQRIEFQNLSEIPDGQGGAEISWVTYQSCWAKIKPSSAGERVFAQKLQDDYDHEIIIRKTIDHLLPKAADRIKFKDRFFQVKSVHQEDEENWWLVIKAKEGVAS